MREMNDCESESGQLNHDVRNLSRENPKVVIPIVRWRRESYTIPIKIRSRLVSIRFCGAVLGISEFSVMRLIERGDLEWAWDLRRKDARRSFVFVLTENLRIYQDKFIGKRGMKKSDLFDWESVVRMVLPGGKPLIKGSEIVCLFSISSQHMMNLVNDGLLKALNERRGRTSTPLITRESVIEMLKSRLIK